MRLSNYQVVSRFGHSTFFGRHYNLIVFLSFNFFSAISLLLMPGVFGWLGVAFIFVYFKFFTHCRLHRRSDVIRTWFGVPGSGKTTLAAYLARETYRSGSRPVLSNVDLAGAYRLDPVKDLGVYSTYFNGYGSHVIIDEATIDFDGRDYKSFSASNKRFFALSRHDLTTVDIFSQAVDFDKRIRDRSSELYYINKSLIPHMICYRRIKKVLTVDKDSHQMIDGFTFVPFSRKLIWSRPLWILFNSYDRDLCPKAVRAWIPWSADGDQISVQDQFPPPPSD